MELDIQSMATGKKLYIRKGVNGRKMYFRDGKMISQKSYAASLKARSRSKRQTRRPSRSTKKRGVPRLPKIGARSKMKKTLPHPSVTGMASGLAIAAYLNAGKTVTDKYSSIQMDGVIKDITDGQLGQAFSTLSSNAVNMISTDTGRKTLVTAGGIAALGAFARRQFPQLKLGGSKLYFRI